MTANTRLQRRRVIVVCVLICVVVQGCRAPSTVVANSLRAPYIPTWQEWMLVKLQANGRIPWGARGYPYDLNFRSGEIPGEFVIEVGYDMPRRDVDLMVAEIKHDIGVACSLVREAVPYENVDSRSGEHGYYHRMIVFPTVKLEGRGLEDLNDEYSKEATKMRSAMRAFTKPSTNAPTQGSTGMGMHHLNMSEKTGGTKQQM
jgi:hypothetical protein